MKRLISLFLSLILVASLVACEESNTDESSQVSMTESSENSEESVVLDEFVLSEDVEKIKSFLTADVDRNLKATNILRGRHYTISRETDPAYPDSGGWKLTDGMIMDVFDQGWYMGWKGGTAVEIVFDLEQSVYSIADVEVECLRVTDYGIGLPHYVTLSVSNDGEDWTDIARIDTPKKVTDVEKYTYSFALPKATNARYLRIGCSNQDGAFLFIDEISAFQYHSSGTIDRTLGADVFQDYTITDMYDYHLNLGESDVNVSENDSDYNKVQNLAMLDGVDFQIFHFDAMRQNNGSSDKSLIKLLNDGVRNGEMNKVYFQSKDGTGRHIIADLGHIMAVDGASFTFYDKYTWGVSTPVVYYVSVSENGTDWVTVYGYKNVSYGKAEKVEDTHEIEFEKSYRARYVRLTFETAPVGGSNSMVYMSEFEVIGKKNPEGAVTAEYDPNIPFGRYAMPEDFGINNFLFAPITNGYGNHCTDKHVMTEEFARIFLATYDDNGKANGVFMDTIAFSTRGALNDLSDRSAGMSFFFDELFYDGVNLDIVNKVKGEINAELGTNDKVKIFVSVNAPKKGDTFQGKAVEGLDDYAECLNWQVDECLKRFNEKGYQNLEFVGFYWQHESVRDFNTDPIAMEAFNDYVHSLGYITFWCPYYNAAGSYIASFVGFDITCLQPNYMFVDTEPTRMYTVAERAKIYGMCVEIEIEGGEKGEDAIRLYRDYLKAGYDTGYMSATKVFYQGALPGAITQGFDTDDEYKAVIYDESVLYALGKLDENYHTNSASSIDKFADAEITVKHGAKASIELGSLEGISYRYVTVPSFGSVQVDASGKLTYKAMKGYAGADTIKLEVFDGISAHKIITVTVTVTETAE